jgi:integrase
MARRLWVMGVHPHMLLRHACGFKLANDGHDTRALQHNLGHKNIQHAAMLPGGPLLQRASFSSSRALAGFAARWTRAVICGSAFSNHTRVRVDIHL